MSKHRFALVLAAAVVTASTLTTPGATAASKISPAESAIRAAAKQQRYAVVTFYKKNDPASTKMLSDAKSLQAKYSKRAGFISVDAGNAAHKELMVRYRVDRSPMPLTVVVAPNGALTAGLPKEISDGDLSGAFVSSGMAGVLKALQSGKMAAVCLQTPKTKHNKESLSAAQGLSKLDAFRGAVDVVKVDPSDRSEAKLIQKCLVDGASDEAQIVVIAPPGRVVGMFDGNATTESISASLTASLAKSPRTGCGCGPGGCGR